MFGHVPCDLPFYPMQSDIYTQSFLNTYQNHFCNRNSFFSVKREHRLKGTNRQHSGQMSQNIQN